VIGGMISSRDETSIRKAPFLGDIPVLGQLFRYDSRSTIRSELLIFLTPRIVNGPEEEECLKDIEMGRLHFIEAEAEEAHGPLRAIPPEELFEEGQPPWIPGVPPSPSIPTQPPALPPPSGTPPNPIPTVVPPRPPTEAPPTPAVPPPPDPGLTKINALRALSIEQDEDEPNRGVVSPANYTTTSNAKNRNALLKRISESQK
jgi:general secretion pathway protein D